MALTTFFVILLESIIQYPQMVSEELDEATVERMVQRHIYLSHLMAQILQELEQRRLEQSRLEQTTQEKSGEAWGSLLSAALQYQPLWAIAGLLVLLVGLWWCFRRWSHQADNHNDDRSSGYRTEEEEEEEEEDDDENDVGRFIEEHIQLPVQDITRDCRRALSLVHTFILLFGELNAHSFYPVLQKEIGVGSTFEGWSLSTEDTVFRILVPMMPPRGHTFQLEIRTAKSTEARTCRIRVELLCTCLRPGQMLCFLHHPAEELRRNQEPSLLYTLCTDSYLDVQKTARWFQQMLTAAWVILPLSAKCHLKLLPSNRSCRFQVTRDDEPMLSIEMIFGVQRGTSDIFVSSENTAACFTPSTMWSETYAVAEVKLFKHIATKAPHDSFHLRCLQVFAYIHVGSGFSIYTFKTAVMHLLTTIPLSGWRRKHFLQRLRGIMSYLRCCLEEKRLNHFFFANENVPEEILLPSSFQNLVPPNLFYRLAKDPDTLPEVLRDFSELQDRLRRFLIFGN
ncbi:inositol 1,4,5-trisphosphate receptor-interacting protein-like 1 [Porphyrio hochstetteri]